MPADEDERVEAPPAEASGEAEAGRGSVEQSGDSAVEDSVGVEAEEQEPEPDEPPRDVTELPGVVVGDIDVRVRPGLAWGVIDRLESGASVVVLHRAGGWYRVRYGEELEGWIRATMLDLGEVEEWQVLEEAGPSLIAEWRGEEHGVMGQSADGTEVRLLKMENETSSVIGAPIDEVTLLADGVTLQDLPILIGDETVVFPGDDFGVGQGKILPKANEWMWLPWGWLLAHNDEYIWQWRPETDELEFIRRPPGFAKLSPDGRYLAIANLCPRDLDCSRDNNVVFIPLDGSPQIAFSEDLRDFEVAPTLGMTSNRWVSNLEWSGNSRAVKLQLAMFDRGQEPNAPTTLLFHIEGHMVRFEEFWERELQGRRCYVEIPFAGSSFIGGWEFHDRDTIASTAMCVEVDGNQDFRTAIFTLMGEFIRFGPFWAGGIEDEDAARLRSAEGGDALGEQPHVKWSPLRRHALVFEPSTGRTFLYRAQQHDLRAVLVQSGQSPTDTQAWVPFDPNAEHEWHSVIAYWLKEEQALLLATWYGYVRDIISGAVLLNLSTAQGVELDFGNKPWTHWQAAPVWNPTGDSFQIMLRGEDVLPELLVDGLYSFRLLIVGHSGNVHREIITATSCRLPGHYADVPRHRAHWSADGKLLAVGGRVLGGSFPCPE